MPHQNRVTPYGEIVAIEDRGTLMGNRGILHQNGKIIRKSMHRGWITCLLDFGDNHWEVMCEDRYTPLFFLDEATAWAAGHRPCFACRRERFHAFKKCSLATNARSYKLKEPTMAEIDRVLHRERITTKGTKVTFKAKVGGLPDGTFIDYAGKPYLKWKGYFREWTPGGYVAAITLSPKLQVNVLTPVSIVRCFENGLITDVYEPFIPQFVL